jgi:hypothetical protein
MTTKWPRPPDVSRYSFVRLPLILSDMPKPVIPTMKFQVPEAKINGDTFVSALAPKYIPPALDTVHGVPVVGVLSMKVGNNAEGLQRVQITNVIRSEHNDGYEVYVYPMTDRTPSQKENDYGLFLEDKVQAISGMKIERCLNPYEAILSHLSDEYLLQRELFTFSVADKYDLSLPERLALMLTDDGVGRLEWLYYHKVSKTQN